MEGNTNLGRENYARMRSDEKFGDALEVELLYDQNGQLKDKINQLVRHFAVEPGLTFPSVITGLFSEETPWDHIVSSPFWTIFLEIYPYDPQNPAIESLYHSGDNLESRGVLASVLEEIGDRLAGGLKKMVATGKVIPAITDEERRAGLSAAIKDMLERNPQLIVYNTELLDKIQSLFDEGKTYAEAVAAVNSWEIVPYEITEAALKSLVNRRKDILNYGYQEKKEEFHTMVLKAFESGGTVREAQRLLLELGIDISFDVVVYHLKKEDIRYRQNLDWQIREESLSGRNLEEILLQMLAEPTAYAVSDLYRLFIRNLETVGYPDSSKITFDAFAVRISRLRSAYQSLPDLQAVKRNVQKHLIQSWRNEGWSNSQIFEALKYQGIPIGRRAFNAIINEIDDLS